MAIDKANSAVTFPEGWMGISREWRSGLTEFAIIGVTGDGTWGVVTGHVPSGVEMGKPGEALVLDTVALYPDSTAAEAASLAAGYR